MMQITMKGTGVLILFLFAAITGCLSQSLEILPVMKIQRIPVGSSAVLACKSNVHDPALITEHEWRDPHDRIIRTAPPGQRPEMYTETSPGGKLLLYVTSITRSMAGNYSCYATYANTERLSANVRIDTYVPITFKNAQENQFPIKGRDFKVMCEVTAEPAATVNWFKESTQILTGDRFVVTTDGLIIRNVSEMDDGTYTCRAVVLDTGKMAEKNIRVEVYTKPEMEERDRLVEVREGEVATITCRARGKPTPKYTWIKANNKENLANAPRFQVDELKGTLTINKVESNDYGQYICSAFNGAGQTDLTLDVQVVVPPRIYELLNVTSAVKTETRLTCKASGRPAPIVTFRKRSSSEPYTFGSQPNDPRIIMETQSITEYSEHKQTLTTIIISDIKREDDGLYECIASNKGGEARKNGHLTVQFPPTFDAMPKIPVWSWRAQPVNISCLAESIPNATIKWRMDNYELIETPQIKIYGSGPFSYITVTPTDISLYRHYKCIATNTLGEAEFTTELREAKVPAIIPQVRQEAITATTVRFQIIDPPVYDGPPLLAYMCQYKEQRNYDYSLGLNKTWSINSPYIVEDLKPLYTYTFRFAAINQVGIGAFGGEVVVIMPNRAAPEQPQLLLSSDSLTSLIHSPFPDRYELKWKIPAHNGEPIDRYQITTCQVQKVNGEWQQASECRTEDLNSYEIITHDIKYLKPDTKYRVQLSAHNMMGFSKPAEVYIQTALGLGSDDYMRPRVLSSTAIIVMVLFALVFGLLMLDVLLCVIKRQGLIAIICGRRTKKNNDEDQKLGRDEKEPLKDVDNSIKRNSSIEFDGSRVYATTGNIIGKNSAV